jgi:hypothetical protein
MSDTRIRLTGISNQGLAIITLLVAVLWGCILTERTIRRQALEETLILLRSNRGTTLPTKTPAPPSQPRLQRRSAVQADLKV